MPAIEEILFEGAQDKQPVAFQRLAFGAPGIEARGETVRREPAREIANWAGLRLPRIQELRKFQVVSDRQQPVLHSERQPLRHRFQ